MNLLLLALALPSAFAARPEVVVVISDELGPYEDPVKPFSEALGMPVQTINLHGREIEADVEFAALRQTNPKVIFALGAKAAYAARFRLPSTPMVYAQVLDPGRYGIPGNQVTGVRAVVPAVTYLSQVVSFFPEVRKVGVIRGSSMDNLDEEALRQAANEVGLTVELRKVDSPRELRQAFNELAELTDAVWMSPERDVLTPDAFRTAVEEMRRRQKPLLADTANMVSAGAAFAVTPDPEGVGRQAAVIARKLLDGAAPAVVPVEDPEELYTALNKRTLDAGSIKYEALMLDFASEVIE